MGSRGPAPLPANVHRLRGNPSKLSADRLAGSVEPTVELPQCPAFLDAEARKEWRRIGPLLAELGLVARIDRAALALYCQAWARWRWCESELSSSIARAAEERAACEARGEVWKGGDGFTVATPSGALTYSPHWVGAKTAAEQVHKYLQQFGLSPAARGRVTASSAQLTLPGIPDPKSAWESV